MKKSTGKYKKATHKGKWGISYFTDCDDKKQCQIAYK